MLSACGRANLGRAIGLVLIASSATAQESLFHQRSPLAGGDALLDQADIAGHVFDDADGDGFRDRREAGIPGVVVSLAGGAYAVTGPDGAFLLSRVRSGQQIVSLDVTSLPSGVGAAWSRLVVEVPPAGLGVVDFPVRSGREKVRLGREEKAGAMLVATAQPDPAVVAGNARDQKLVVAGAEVRVPKADIELVGLERGGFLRPNARATARLSVEHGGEPRSWEIELHDAGGRQVGRRMGRGAPPSTLPIDPADPSIPMDTPFAAGQAYSLRLCVDFAPLAPARGAVAEGERACSPYRTFGLIGAAGGREVRPRLERPVLAPGAIVAGRPATLDADQSFLASVPPGAANKVAISLAADDGRTASLTASLPSLSVEAPPRVPLPTAAPTPIKIKGRTAPGARVHVGETAALVMDDGRWSAEIIVQPGETTMEIEATLASGQSATATLRTRLTEKDEQGKRWVLEEAVPELLVELPPARARVRAQETVRGRTAPGNAVEVNGKAVHVADDGSFAAEVDLADAGGIQVRVKDPAGRVGEVMRPVSPGGGAWSATALADASPGAGTAEGVALVGALSASARIEPGAAGRFAAAAGLSTPAGRAMGLDALLGWERALGPILAGVRYARSQRVELGDGAGAGADDALQVSGLWRTGALSIHAEGGWSGNFSLFGGGAGVRVRAATGLVLGARLGLSVEPGGAGVLPEWQADALWRSVDVPLDPALVLRVTRTARAGGAIDDLGTLAASLALVPGLLRLEESAALRRATVAAVQDASTFAFLLVSRLSLRPMPAWLLAADHRLQIAGGDAAHGATAEANYEPLPWMRVGAVGELLAAAGRTEARALARLQAWY